MEKLIYRVVRTAFKRAIRIKVRRAHHIFFVTRFGSRLPARSSASSLFNISYVLEGIRAPFGTDQAAPEPFSTAGIVPARILKSSHNDHSSIYCISSSIHFSKGMELRPFTCQRQVMP